VSGLTGFGGRVGSPRLLDTNPRVAVEGVETVGVAGELGGELA